MTQDTLTDPHELSGGTLIDRLLAEQKELTAVERFSQKHARADFPLQAKYYRDLIPLSKPVGEAPACVQACPHEAIKITLVDVEQVIRDGVPGSTMLPGAYDSSYTLPTTRYLTRKTIPAASMPANAHKLRLEHPHWPLIIMLLLSQTSAGMFATLAFIGAFFPEAFMIVQLPVSAFAFLLLNAGLAGATLHLGRPLGAWRFFLGLRTSWMSREILVFSIFAGAASAAVGTAWFLPESLISLTATASSALLGIIAVFTSAMIYVDTHRKFWKTKYTFPKFYGAAALLGLIATGMIGAWAAWFFSTNIFVLVHGAASTALILMGWLGLWEFSRYREALDDDTGPIHRSALIIERLLPKVRAARDILFVVSGLFLFGAILTGGIPAALFLSLALTSTGLFLVLERYTFFTAVVAYRMPGGI